MDVGTGLAVLGSARAFGPTADCIGNRIKL